MIKSKPLFFLFVFFLVFFLTVTILVGLNFFEKIDLSVTIFLQQVIGRIFDTPFSTFSIVGSFEIVLLFILILWAIHKKLNYFSVLLFLAIFHVVEFLGKYFLNHPNPPLEFVRYDIDFSLPSSAIQTGSSYPSGHVGRTFFISTLLFYVVSKTKLSKFAKNISYLSILVFDILMFTSRIYLGEHWFSDVIGGALLGSLFGLLPLLLL